MNLQFCLAYLSDLDTWMRLRNELYGDLDPQHNEQEIRRTVEDSNLATFFVFEEGSTTPIGMLELSLRNIVDGCLTSPVGYIEGMYVEQPWQGKGIGKKMVEFAKTWALENGCSELAVDTELDNLEAQNFYRHNGFRETFRVVEFRMDLKVGTASSDV
ncbi:MAG: GNAT family N-acetyltransferase [Bacteroidota bacterium]